ncbi:MAG: DUF5123 domain-containing protein [Muribaculaceae bacterium]|nr:DUF5123 domain-containing protein [Muribaculaceae bacterium]
MKLFKYMACGLLVAGSLSVFTACDDDDVLEAPRLFSPVVTISSSANTVVCKWNGIQGATSYELTLQRELTTDDGGNIITEDVKSATVQVDPTGVNHFSPYVFEDLAWDERYRVAIKAIGTDKTSNVFTTELITVNYPTKLKAVSNTIDTGVRIEWSADEGTTTDLAYFNVLTLNEDGTTTPYTRPGAEEPATLSRADEGEGNGGAANDPIVAPEPNDDYYYTLTEDDIRNGYCEIYGLEAGGNYRVVSYSVEGEYRGRRDFKTKEAPVYENPDLVFDLRGLDEEVADTIMCTDFFNTLPENATVILKGGRKYVTKGTPKITKSVIITTGQSLSGKAIISLSGFATEGDINHVEFNNVKLTNLDSDDVNENFGGRYFFNHSNATTVNELVFENVDVKYMRGFVRTRKAGQSFGSISFNNCTLDSIGGYKVIHLDTSDTSIGSISFTNTTFSNVDGVVRANNRDNTSVGSIFVDNCTFAYCSAGAELFAMKRDGCSPNLQFSMTNCIIGGNFVGKTGMGASFNDGVAPNFSTIYVTSDFVWAIDDKTGDLKNPLGGYDTMSQSVNDIWVDPANLDFTLKNAQLPCAAAGDPRWHVQ